MSVRTPIALQTSVISDHISEFHGATAPPSIERESSGTSESMFTFRTIPVPPHVGHAPVELNEKSSAHGGSNSAPHSGHISGLPAATFTDGGTKCPLGQTWLPRRENISRRLLESSVSVPNVLLTLGTDGRWRRARAAGTFSICSTFALSACDSLRRVYADNASR